MKAFSKITTFIMLIISISCQQNNYLTGNSQPEIVTVKTTTVTASDNAFGLNLFQNLSRTNIDENRLISPLSVSAVLAMAYNGAEKDTRTQMEKAMMLNGLSKEQINDGYKTLLSELELADEQVVFDIANALYYSGNFSVKPEFLEVNKKVYDAEISGLDFSSPEAVQTVNNWVAEKTNGKINNIVSQLQPLDRMILLNAIYFYGTWSSEFDKYGTQNLQFIKNDNNHIEVPMMNLMDKVP